MIVYYICNKEKFCARDGGCGDDMCNHTSDVHFAKNDDAIRIFNEFIKTFNEFIKTFEIYVDEDKCIYAVEKEEA